MGKIVGNFFLIIMCIWFHGIYAELSLRILNTDRSSLTQAGAGHPFLVEVSISDATTIGQVPEIQGLDQFIAKNTGVHITSVNNKTTAKYIFEVKIDTPGTYTIGPAKYGQQQSNSERVVVGNEQIVTKNSNTKRKNDSVLLRLMADKERAVVGERVHCRLRFYTTDEAISLRRCIEQEVKDIRRQKMQGPKEGVERLNGVDYHCVEWEWDIFPQKEGDCVIPAYGADYEREVEREDIWGGLGRFLGNYVETKRIYSNALSLLVDPLPATTEPIQAIGEFSAMTIHAKPAVAKQGEGIVVTIDIIGNGDFDSIKYINLQDIPETLRYYESKQSVIEPTKEGEVPRKRYEFIVQGLKAGSWEIPAQSLYYFDTKKRKYMTLQTTPLTITIMPSTKATSLKNQPDVNHNNSEEPDVIAPLHKELAVYPVEEMKISWWLFLGLVFLPLLFSCYNYGSYLFFKKHNESYPLRRAKKAFSIAKKQLEVIKKENNVQELYKLFIMLFADRWQESVASISISRIDQQLQKIGIEEQELVSWNLFFSRIAECAFGMCKNDDTKNLFEKAEQWIQRLEKLL